MEWANEPVEIEVFGAPLLACFEKVEQFAHGGAILSREDRSEQEDQEPSGPRKTGIASRTLRCQSQRQRTCPVRRAGTRESEMASDKDCERARFYFYTCLSHKTNLGLCQADRVRCPSMLTWRYSGARAAHVPGDRAQGDSSRPALKALLQTAQSCTCYFYTSTVLCRHRNALKRPGGVQREVHQIARRRFARKCLRRHRDHYNGLTHYPDVIGYTLLMKLIHLAVLAAATSPRIPPASSG
jgi:hypothetical protein